MKKGILAVLIVVVVAAAGYLLVRQHGTVPSAVGTASSVPSSSAPASSAPSSAPEVSSAAAAPSSAASGIPKAQAVEQIQKAVPVDWKKYTVKPASQSEQKTVNGKKYQTYLMWDEDYQVGPAILVDPDGGKVYTWTESDSAPVPASEDKAFDKTEHTVTGTVKDAAMMSVLIKTSDGRELSIRRLGIDTSGLKSLTIGSKIKVTYTGVISGNDTSRAFIKKLSSL